MDVRAPRFALAALAAALALSPPSGTTAVAQPVDGPVLVLAGDLIYDTPVRRGVERRAAHVGRAAGLAEIFAEVAPVFEAADLVMLNLETPVAERVRRHRRGERPAIFTAPEDLLTALRGAGVHVLVLANNHALDQRRRGLAQTIARARAAGFTVVGAGAGPAEAPGPAIVEVAGARIALVAWTQETNHHPARDEPGPHVAFVRDGTIERAVRAARDHDPALIVASFHWTVPTGSPVGEAARDAARRAAEAGADLVVGHGPHVPGPVEPIETSSGRRALALYSLGNLLATMEPGEDVRAAPVARVRTRRRADGRLEPTQVEIVPFWIAHPAPPSPWRPGGETQVRPVSLHAELARVAASDCGEVCDAATRRLTARVARMRRQMVTEGALVRVVGPGPLAPAPPPVEPSVEAPASVAQAPRPPMDLEAIAARAARGVELAGGYARGDATPGRVEEEALAAVIALLSSRPRLRARLVGRARDSEPEGNALARRRAIELRRRLARSGVAERRVDVAVGRRAGDTVELRLLRE